MTREIKCDSTLTQPTNSIWLADLISLFHHVNHTNLAKRMSKKDSEKKANRSLRMKAFISKSAKENHACELTQKMKETRKLLTTISWIKSKWYSFFSSSMMRELLVHDVTCNVIGEQRIEFVQLRILNKLNCIFNSTIFFLSR